MHDIQTMGIIGMRMRPHHPHYNKKSPGLDELFAWQETQLRHWGDQGIIFHIGCADHWDARAMKWLFYNGYDKQIRLILPFPGFGKKQGEDWKVVRRLLESRGQARYVYPSEPKVLFDALNKRNQELIRDSDVILWLWDGVQTDAYDLLVQRKKHIAFPWEAYVNQQTGKAGITGGFAPQGAGR